VSDAVSAEELQLATRNHGMPLEALRWDVTPVGLHYLLVHYDVPMVDIGAIRLRVGGHVREELSLSLDDLRLRETLTEPVTMECAGNGRALLDPRPVSQPWVREAVGTGEWTGTPLAPLLEQAGVLDGAVDVVFTGLDHGVEGGLAQAYARALPVAAAARPEVLLAWGLNGQALPPQHGFPLRLVVPGWYGMTNVKWLASIEVLNRRYDGYQNEVAYRLRATEDDPGVAITRMMPRALMAPPGVPEFMSRRRHLPPGPVTVEGRAWSGWGEIDSVELAVDGEWRPARVEPGRGRFAWSRWTAEWDATAGVHELACRCTDASGNTQPDVPPWNVGGYANNAVQRVEVIVA
jgi:DMSO/TMAO reductase YedYZ molybdopterin-dependent catalytic subunit